MSNNKSNCNTLGLFDRSFRKRLLSPTGDVILVNSSKSATSLMFSTTLGVNLAKFLQTDLTSISFSEDSREKSFSVVDSHDHEGYYLATCELLQQETYLSDLSILSSHIYNLLKSKDSKIVCINDFSTSISARNRKSLKVIIDVLREVAFATKGYIIVSCCFEKDLLTNIICNEDTVLSVNEKNSIFSKLGILNKTLNVECSTGYKIIKSTVKLNKKYDIVRRVSNE